MQPPEPGYTFDYLDTPIGSLLVAASNKGLAHLRFDDERRDAVLGRDWHRAKSELLERAGRQLLEYFAGRRRAFDLPLAPRGTSFQRSVWSAVAALPFGCTVAYSTIATRIGRPRAVRAVGAANGRNPVPIIIPCHRVIGADGSLTGFGGGLQLKRYLLDLEGIRMPTQPVQLALQPI